MKSRRYTSSELFQMRHAPLVKDSAARIHAALSRVPELGVISGAAVDPLKTRLARIPEELREFSTDSSNSARNKKHVAARQLDGTESEWKYRGGTESEDMESQPISAPTGLAAQKDEGFQRFYRAVASPTHVRVTAGGRIVPNTRASVSPIPKWMKDRNGSGASFVPPHHMRGHFDQPAYPMMPGHPLTVFPAMFPPMPGSLAPGMSSGPPAFPVMPWPVAMNLPGPFPYDMPPPPRHDGSRGDWRSDGHNPNDSHHSQIGRAGDQYPLRPIFVNGQWMMPTGATSFPYPIAPGQGYHSASDGAPMVYPSGMHMVPTNRSATTKLPSSEETDARLSNAGPRATGPAKPVYPLKSSIRASDITKRHLEILRSRLKYLEDQLSFNKHQIDEKTVESDARMVRQYIDQFKENLEIQLSYEDSHYPPRGTNSGSRPRTPSYEKPGTRSTNLTDKQPTFDKRNCSNSDKKSGASVTRFGEGINSTKSASAFAGWQPTADSPAEGLAIANAKTSLPVTAAMAAPFRPRTDAPLLASKSSDTAHMPYLRGRVPDGVDPSLVRDTDYVYDRALSSDELRARHIYWGQAPAEQQQGLPKFDGKDFFRASEGDFAQPIKSSDPFEGLGQTATIRTRNGLGFSTQSESLPRPAQGSSDSQDQLTIATNRTTNSTRIGRSMEDLNKGSQNTPPTSSGSAQEKSSSEETTDDDREILYTGRKNMTRMGQRMLPIIIKNSTGSNASISSTTAQGLLPNYTGYATASLTPTIANRMAPNVRNAAKLSQDETKPASMFPAKSGENLPPGGKGDNAF